MAPATYEFRDNEWSIWNKVDIESPKTLKEFIAHFESEYGLEVSMISYVGPRARERGEVAGGAEARVSGKRRFALAARGYDCDF